MRLYTTAELEKIDYVKGILLSYNYHLRKARAIKEQLDEAIDRFENAGLRSPGFDANKVPQKHLVGTGGVDLVSLIDKKDRLQEKYDYALVDLYIVDRYLDSLDAGLRYLVSGYFIHHYSYTYLSETTGIPISTIRMKINNALLKYKEYDPE